MDKLSWSDAVKGMENNFPAVNLGMPHIGLSSNTAVAEAGTSGGIEELVSNCGRMNIFDKPSDIIDAYMRKKALDKLQNKEEEPRLSKELTEKLNNIDDETFKKILSNNYRPQVVLKNKYVFTLSDYMDSPSKHDERPDSHVTLLSERSKSALKKSKHIRSLETSKQATKLKKKILQIRELQKTEQAASEQTLTENGPNFEDSTEIAVESKNKLMHSRNFRPYCDNLLLPDLSKNVELLFMSLFRYQQRAYELNPIKAAANPRFVVGFREVNLRLETKKFKLIVIAPDMEKSEGPGGLDELVRVMKSKCAALDIPYVFALKRRMMGYLLKKKVPISCVGILNYSGADFSFDLIMKHLQKARKLYANSHA